MKEKMNIADQNNQGSSSESDDESPLHRHSKSKLWTKSNSQETFIGVFSSANVTTSTGGKTTDPFKKTHDLPEDKEI
jgi:hypothetical protein